MKFLPCPFFLLSALAAVAFGQPTAPSSAKAPEAPYPDPPVVQPGRGLAHHDFLYTGEWDTRKPLATLFLVRGGKVSWTYQIPTKDETNGQLSEFSDIHRLSNGDVLFAYKTGWRKIDATGKTIHDYKCPQVGTGADGKAIWSECHAAIPVGNDRVLFMQNGLPAKLMLFNLTTGNIEMEHIMKTKEPVDAKSIHGQFRNVRLTKSGHYLIAHMNLGRVIEYDPDWKEVWSCEAPSVWDAVRLTNGNTLIAGNQHAFVREINPRGEIVWEVKNGDVPGLRLNGVHQVTRLANGNTVICNWTNGVKKPDWPKIVQVIEVTPEKKVVWAFNEWTHPDLGPASCIQLLDEPGIPENRELMR